MFLLFQAQEGALAGPPQGFAAKRAFSINLRRGFQVRLGVQQGQQLCSKCRDSNGARS
jgi:hypothetical protein